jgi:hypothetical protein
LAAGERHELSWRGEEKKGGKKGLTFYSPYIINRAVSKYIKQLPMTNSKIAA